MKGRLLFVNGIDCSLLFFRELSKFYLHATSVSITSLTIDLHKIVTFIIDTYCNTHTKTTPPETGQDFCNTSYSSGDLTESMVKGLVSVEEVYIIQIYIYPTPFDRFPILISTYIQIDPRMN